MRKLKNEELQRKSLEEFRQSSKTPLIIVLDNVRSLNNVGSAFRTADAFLLEGVYLCGFTGTPPHREIQKTALGATESVAWKHVPSCLDALQELKQKGFDIYAAEQADKAIPLDAFQPGKEEKLAIVFGNEVDGVAQEVMDACDGVLEIPQVGTKHSLNISVSVGIVVWDIYRKMKRL